MSSPVPDLEAHMSHVADQTIALRASDFGGDAVLQHLMTQLNTKGIVRKPIDVPDLTPTASQKLAEILQAVLDNRSIEQAHQEATAVRYQELLRNSQTLERALSDLEKQLLTSQQAAARAQNQLAQARRECELETKRSKSARDEALKVRSASELLKAQLAQEQRNRQATAIRPAAQTDATYQSLDRQLKQSEEARTEHAQSEHILRAQLLALEDDMKRILAQANVEPAILRTSQAASKDEKSKQSVQSAAYLSTLLFQIRDHAAERFEDASDRYRAAEAEILQVKRQNDSALIACQSKIASLNAQIDERESDRADMAELLARLQGNLTSCRISADRDLAEARTEADSLRKAQITALEEQLETAEAELARLNARISMLESQTARLQQSQQSETRQNFAVTSGTQGTTGHADADEQERQPSERFASRRLAAGRSTILAMSDLPSPAKRTRTRPLDDTAPRTALQAHDNLPRESSNSSDAKVKKSSRPGRKTGDRKPAKSVRISEQSASKRPRM
ncbi:uncharacterized protein L969DRAFT_48275 [Mixia osmundae IAM 14324]|uniref:Uncharacterized protein n=1 Tax=Mixia osmundae (strain CBS 9802 / IAM 14324 / JCM 22182 / KY 12970) TaxID=764103 RepID=G7E6E7_MIXOS|nr:uncharacterized protein L969DRAFT_48275 [Mixia osmundae IAM 14324]KEI40435.1 hypothetical protein L969DRAFT_48275 [Mixia osmundae IAM 14324]GAA98407.1 hypothetical protein E5Q_05093 [Mixia osmundae IAM 14324]